MQEVTSPPRLVFTDLDGSLLDHHDYDWEPARPWLNRLAAAGVPVIPVTSKTRAELLPLRRELGLEQTPFIAENGAIIGLPAAWQHARLDRDPANVDGLRVKALGVDIDFLTRRLRVIRERLQADFRCLPDMSIEEIVEATGLDAPRAELARAREGSIPLLWHDSEAKLDALQEMLINDNLTLTQGGRFWHVMGSADKGRAVNWLMARFAALRGVAPWSLGLGTDPMTWPC
ncbi:HAD-IIB family hydrolase [Modicisalibacter luteus]|uniref:HAD-IIB family hydrolase n=1 Tax=Modicisalibacter luteus TaxID=453962 RepID=UPI00363A5747